jgi:tripartite ATP-independent transporter DctM subunit
MLDLFIDYMPLFMFLVLAILLFSGYPVAAVLGGTGLGFGYLGVYLGVFVPIEFFNIVGRIWSGIADNLVLVAIPMFIFMGTMLEKSGVARDLLYCLQILLRRVPGGLALAVTAMGTIMAATTGIIGASVVMMTLMALPVMLQRQYSVPLATGTIAASGTLGILIPPSIMLVIMADLLGRSVGNLFVAAVFPGLLLASIYAIYILTITSIKPSLAPPLPSELGPQNRRDFWVMILRGLIPPVFLIVLVLGSIVGGWATPTEASGVGAAGAILLAAMNRRLNFETLRAVVERSALTGAMLFFIFIGATAFSYVFRSLGGDDIVIEFVENTGFGPWGILFVLMGIVFLLGFFFDWIEITLIVLPVFAPIIALLDFGDHVAKVDLVYWFAILVAVNLQTSFLTPPFGFALFYMKGVAPPEVKIQQIYIGIIPFVMLQVIGVTLVMAFPEIALWLPNKVLN